MQKYNSWIMNRLECNLPNLYFYVFVCHVTHVMHLAFVKTDRIKTYSKYRKYPNTFFMFKLFIR